MPWTPSKKPAVRTHAARIEGRLDTAARRSLDLQFLWEPHCLASRCGLVQCLSKNNKHLRRNAPRG